jgi:hypothetical protein
MKMGMRLQSLVGPYFFKMKMGMRLQSLVGPYFFEMKMGMRLQSLVGPYFFKMKMGMRLQSLVGPYFFKMKMGMRLQSLVGPYFFEMKMGMRLQSLVGPYFFEMKISHVMLKCYGASPHQNLVVVELSSRSYGSSRTATAHTARASRDLVPEMFSEHVTSLRGELARPARSPDLSACDYFPESEVN